MTTTSFTIGATLLAQQLNDAFAASQPFPATTPSRGNSSTDVATTAYVTSVLNILLPENYGAVSGTVGATQKITNVTAINAAVTAALPLGGNVPLGPFTYQLNGTVVLPPGPTIVGVTLSGTYGLTRLEQYNATGIDTVHWGPPVGNALGQTIFGGGISGIWIVSMVDLSTVTPPAGHLGAQLSITNGFLSRFKDIIIGEYNQPVASTNHYSYKGLAQDPASGPVNSWFENIDVKGYGQNGIDASATTSGNIWHNVMIANGGLGEASLKTSNGFALVIGNGEGIWDEINIEWSIFNASTAGAIFMPSSAGIRFGHLHLEGLQLSSGSAGTRGSFILVPGSSISRFESIHMISTNLPTGCNVASAGLFGFGFGGNYSNISLGQILVAQTLPLGAGVNWYLAVTYEGPGAGTATNCQIDFVGPFLFFGDGSFASKFTGWSDCNFAATNRGPANGLGVPPSNLVNSNVYSITTGSPGYSAGTYTQTNYDGINTYVWTAAVNGTINMAQTIDPLLPVSIPAFPGMRRRVVNGSAANTVAVHNVDTTNILTAASLSAGQWTEIVFNGTTGKWQQISAGTLL